jgi:DNA-binding transcriptional regulator YiaG
MPRVPAVDVAELRRELGLTVEEFARRYGMAAASIRKWESGEARPFRMARVLLAIIAAHPDMVDDVLRIRQGSTADRAWRAFPDA